MSKTAFRSTMFTIVTFCTILGMILAAMKANETVTFIVFLFGVISSIFWVFEESQEW